MQMRFLTYYLPYRRKDPESDVAKDFGVQMEVLKHFSCEQLANSALATKLKKDKILSSNPLTRSIFAELTMNLPSLGEPGTPQAKVQSRMLSSKALASEVVSIVETMRTLVHSVGSEETTDKTQPPQNTAKRKRTGHKKDASSSMGDNIIKPSGEYVNTSGDEAIDETEDGWESGTVDALSETGLADVRDSDDATSGPESSADEADIPSAGPRSKQSPSHESKGQSEFLPSLSVGFIQGDSDSEFSDDETKLVDGTRKNRRGQRARRAIWEKKFGKHANHVKKTQAMTIRGIRYRPVNADRRSGKGRSYLRPDRTPIPSRTQHEPVGTSQGVENSGSMKERTRAGDVRGKPGDRPSHPSWEAKRKQKVACIVPSQGTKIVFAES